MCFPDHFKFDSKKKKKKKNLTICLHIQLMQCFEMQSPTILPLTGPYKAVSFQLRGLELGPTVMVKASVQYGHAFCSEVSFSKLDIERIIIKWLKTEKVR